MGVIELQVFVSLVVILGAAFVALICDFLKGNNEQLRESNIVLRVREDERTLREDLVERVQERVQRQTLEVLTQVQRVSGQRPVTAAKPVPAKPAEAQPATQPASAFATETTAASDPKGTSERGYAERSGRVRRPRPAQAPTEATPPVPIRTDAEATWAQDVILRRHPHPEVKPVPEPDVPMETQIAAQPQQTAEPVRALPALQFEAFDIRQAAPALPAADKPAAAPVESPAPALVSAQQAIPIQPMAGRIPATIAAAAPENVELRQSMPASDARPELSIEILPEAALELMPEPVAELPVPENASEMAEAVEAPSPAMAGATGIPLSAGIAPAAAPAWTGAPVLQEAAASLPSADSRISAPLAPRFAGVTEITQSPLALPVAQAGIAADRLAPSEIHGAVPTLQLQAEAPAFEVVEPVAEASAAADEAVEPSQLAEPHTADTSFELPVAEDPQVVRVRVLRDDDLLNDAELLSEEAVAELLNPAIAELQPPAAGLEPPVLAGEPLPELEPLELAPVAEVEPALASQFPSFDAGIALEDPFLSLEEILTPSTLEQEPWLKEAAAQAQAPLEVRSNVVEMPVSALRPQEPEKPAVAELAIPGGFHEATSLARLMEEERPFHGLVIAISVVDHVRLLADQGKPATEQLMASVTRLVVSMAREQDFACRMGEDEFILIFGRETGAAAKRRIQLVSERLWDFQLRSLGSVSIIFSWGAAESQAQPLMQTVENAREQMIETRRNRRAYNSGSSRFRRRAAN